MVKLPQFPKFRGFAGETKLHGIPRIVEGSWTSISLWSVLAIVCIGMAINDLITMVGQYQSDEVAIQVSLQDNSNYTWPTPTLCMEVVQHFNPPSMEHHNKYYEYTGYNAIDNFTRIYEHLDSVGNYTEIEDGWSWIDHNRIYYPYMILGYLQQLEQILLGTNQQYLTDYQLSLATNDPRLREYIGVTHMNFISKNVTMEKLTRWIGMLECLSPLMRVGSQEKFNVAVHFENYRYFGDPQYIPLPFCRADLITHLGFGMVCTKLFKEPNVPNRPGYNFFTIYGGRLIDPTRPSFETTSTDGPLTLTFDQIRVIPNLQWHLDLQGRDTTPVDRSGIFSWNPSENVVLDISISNEYKFFNRPTYRCSNAAETQYQCEWRKRLELVHKQCGCWPTLADLSNSNVSAAVSCNSLVNFTVSQNNSFTAIVPSEFCPSIHLTQSDTFGCLPDCHLTNFKLTRRQTSRMSDPNFDHTSSTGQFEFRFIPDQSQLIEEQPVYDWNNFMGQWGGSIGTWLGASVLSFVHIPVYLLRQYCMKKKAVESSEETTKSDKD